MMESPNAYPESPLDQEDIVYPCKGCGEILEEGKAFELAGNRWHIDCFRCNTCGTLLDSDANLLLLGDGSLICNNCTYSCSACNQKIEDLAILTGDQAFCSGCFRCRNCKRKIENLRYARTSQGIFCMSCHESLMARRRKKARTPKQSAGSSTAEKALPSLPPGAAQPSAFTPDGETPPEPHSDNQIPQRDRQAAQRNGSTSNNHFRQEISPLSDDAHRDGPTLPASTYGENRPSNVSSSVGDDDSERGFLPMAFDPTPVPAPQQQSAPKGQYQRASDPSPKENRPPQDYFGARTRLSAKPASRDPSQEHKLGTNVSSRSVSTEREPDKDRPASSTKPSPHILYQEKGRSRKKDSSEINTPVNRSATGSPVSSQLTERPERTSSSRPPHARGNDRQQTAQEGFRLQEVPDSRRAISRKSSRSAVASPTPAPQSQRDPGGNNPASPQSLESQYSDINPFDDPKRKDIPVHGPTPALPSKHADRSLPLRGDSLAAAAVRSKQSSPDPSHSHKRDPSTSSVPSSFTEGNSGLSRENSRSRHEPPARTSFELVPPPRSSTRPTAPSAPSKSVANDDFIAPRHAPPPPPPERHRNQDSISTMQSEERDTQMSPALRSAGLPKYSLDGGFSMDDEMGRILRGEHHQQSSQSGNASPSMLRRVSNAVKHGRSHSDRAVTQGGRSPRNGSIDITPVASPMTSSTLDGQEVHASLRRAQLHIAELESEKRRLQEKLESSGDIKAVNSELREKRSTMAFLDTQREMVVRELEVMTDHLSKAKDNSQPLDLSSLKTNILRDFAESLQQLKDSMGSQVEELMRKRHELTDEIGNLIQMKDKGFQEYESLSGKNAQLAAHNNELIRSIQGMYNDNRHLNGSIGSNGLGIYNGKDGASAEVRNLNPVITDPSMPNLLQDPDGESATILTAPQVVNIRKGAQAKKFNWRRGGEKVAGKVTKGIKGAFAGDNRDGKGQYTIGMPYNTQHQAVGGSEQSSLNSKHTLVDEKSAAYGGFLKKENGGARGSSSTNVATGDGTVLFGSELSARCDFEGRLVPGIVSRCISEVESRGMDVEGIYRKSGGAGQVKQVQQGFEKDNNFDISDEDLDIHAVTSVLKQYFRKLPTPLIDYESYDALLEAGQMQDREKQAVALRAAVESLPDAHRDCLMYLFTHLGKVISFESKNLMTPLNLAVVFAPTIMRPQTIEREMSDMQSQRQAVQALLEHQKTVFAEEE